MSPPFTCAIENARLCIVALLVARLLAQDAPIALLDEPTSALDVGNQKHVLDLVEDLVPFAISIFAIPTCSSSSSGAGTSPTLRRWASRSTARSRLGSRPMATATASST